MTWNEMTPPREGSVRTFRSEPYMLDIEKGENKSDYLTCTVWRDGQSLPCGEPFYHLHNPEGFEEGEIEKIFRMADDAIKNSGC